MNAIVGLCHFCEAHGPRPLFCTFTTDNEDHTTEPSKSAVQCTGCASIGTETVFVSRDNNNTIFCSRESVPNPDVTAFLRQAALRSITCEVSWNKEGGVVYFSDTQGHVLSHMFHIKDTRARGLKRMFSIVVLMKDKMLLLNITPVLSEHMQRVSRELQQLADVVYDNEQSICSQRALRLKTGVNDFGQTRSLAELTGDSEIFKKLHSHFTWILRSGALTYTETLYTSPDLLNNITVAGTKGTIFENNACSVPDKDDLSIRELDKILTRSIFKILLYCTLTGVDIIIESRNINPDNIIKTLSRLLPKTENNVLNIKSNSQCQATGSSTGCHLKEIENRTFECQWNGILPVKCPTLMNKIENGIDNESFNEAILNQHIKYLQLEWLGIANTLKTALKSSNSKSEAINKLKQILGVKTEDESLITYWLNNFCD